MKNRYEILQVRDVPEALDRKILAAAALSARRRRIRRSMMHGIWSSVAAAAAVMIAFGVFLFPDPSSVMAVPTKAVQNELLALSDWSTLEQESFNLNFEIYSGRQSVELASLNEWGGFQDVAP